MITRKFYLSQEQDDTLRRISDLSGISVSEHLRIAIEEYLTRKTREKLNISTSQSKPLKILRGGEVVDNV